MPTTKKRRYCVKCGGRKVTTKMISIACQRVRYKIIEPFKLYMCHDCAGRFSVFLNQLDFSKSGALARTPKK